MKHFHTCVRFLVSALLACTCGVATFAQDEEESLSGDNQTSQTGLTGVGKEDSSLTAAKPGGADGLGDLLLGGDRRPLYRLRASDVVELSFTVAPEFNQTLTV